MTLDEFERLYKEYSGELDIEVASVVLDTGWQDDGKYQNCEVVYKVGEDYFSVVRYRSGSYWEDYDYGDLLFYKVVPYEVTKIEYKIV
jgi:hypothetical protein